AKLYYSLTSTRRLCAATREERRKVPPGLSSENENLMSTKGSPTPEVYDGFIKEIKGKSQGNPI
ncbi:MAG TPA: hypothetical protein V6C72_10090, partial [Chroococcales cyanobacterium]